MDVYEENHTAQSNNAADLVALIEACQKTEQKSVSIVRSDNIFSQLLWISYRHLRVTKSLKGVYPNPGIPQKRASLANSANASSTRERFFLDNFVRNHLSLSLQMRYIFAVLTLQWRTAVMGAIGGE